MATATPSALAGIRDGVSAPLNALATVVALILASLAITAQVSAPSPLLVVVVPAVLALVAWMLVSERYEWTLVVLMLYIGLADGYLKLRTDSQPVTLLRDALLYAIATGALVRIAVRRERVSLPPLTGWVFAWCAVVAIQIANPYNGTLAHSIASVRPHVEWIPLFFLGYLVVRSKARLRNFLLLLLVIAAANGIVGLVQQNLTPEQLSSWGPGYEKALKGESSVSARTFADEEGNEHNRPFALGGDIGFGGTVGFLAVPAALALIGLALKPPLRFAVGALSIGVVLAIITSAARVDVIAGVVAVLAFAGLTVTSRGGLRAVLAVAAGVAIGYVALGFLFSDAGKGSYSRYNSISNPAAAVDTAFDYRGGVIAKVPSYAVEIPLGAGLGSKGPAGSFAGGGGRGGFNGESEPTYLLIELGLPGLLVMLAFNLFLLYLSVTRIRRIEDRETRVLLTAIAAPLFALFVTWFAGVATATVPGAPYLWFGAGVLSYWLLGPGSGAALPADGASLAGAGSKARWPRWSTA